MYWLHWIGKQYYPTMRKFVEEAEECGATRRVALNTLKQMQWGDTVLCVMKHGKTGVVFGSFKITVLSGMGADYITNCPFEVAINDKGGEVVMRLCGEYITGSSYHINEPLRDIAVDIKKAQEDGIDIGKPMVGGEFVVMNPIRLRDIPFRQGYRTIDGKKLLEQAQLNEQTNGKRRVKGQFYVNDSTENTPLPLKFEFEKVGAVQTVKNYRRA